MNQITCEEEILSKHSTKYCRFVNIEPQNMEINLFNGTFYAMVAKAMNISFDNNIEIEHIQLSSSGFLYLN